jgi:hypothetical protein
LHPYFAGIYACVARNAQKKYDIVNNFRHLTL